MQNLAVQRFFAVFDSRSEADNYLTQSFDGMTVLQLSLRHREVFEKILLNPRRHHLWAGKPCFSPRYSPFNTSPLLQGNDLISLTSLRSKLTSYDVGLRSVRAQKAVKKPPPTPSVTGATTGFQNGSPALLSIDSDRPAQCGESKLESLPSIIKDSRGGPMEIEENRSQRRQDVQVALSTRNLVEPLLLQAFGALPA